MTLEEKISQDLKAAMKAKDQAQLRSVRAIKQAIQIFKTSGTGEVLDTSKEIALLQKLVKQRRDSLEIYEKEGREDLAIKEKEEIDVLTTYLPEQLSEDDLKKEIEQIVQQTGASGMKDMGRVMGIANKNLAGKAEGKTIATIVKSLLS